MAPVNRVDLSISIVNTNNRAITMDCLRSILESTHQISYEILVVDNGSTDGSADMIRTEFPEVVLIVNETKQGFSTNHNKALARARGRYLMILNDDVIVLEGAFDRLVAFLDEYPGVGIVGPKFLNPDGTNQPAFGRFGSPFYDLVVKPWRRRFQARYWDREQPTEVDWIVGACLLVRRKATEQAGLLDTAFDPLYSEEQEWCYRIKLRGWKAYHVPEARIIHLGGQTRKRTPEFWTRVVYAHKLLFFQKHYSAWRVLEFRALLALLSLGRAIYWAGAWLFRLEERDLSRRRFRCHQDVLRQVALTGKS